MKLSDLSDEEWFRRLSARHLAQQTAIREWWQYYEQPAWIERPWYALQQAVTSYQVCFIVAFYIGT